MRIRKKISWASLVVSIILFGIIFFMWSYSRPEIKDCGKDIECFKEALKKCEMATVVTDYPFPWFISPEDFIDPSGGSIKIITGLQVYTEIKGGDPNGCIIYTHVDYEKGRTGRIQGLVTGDMTCTAPVDVLFDEYFKFKVFRYCKGRLLDNFNKADLEYEEKEEKLFGRIFEIAKIAENLTVNESIFVEITISDILQNVTYNERHKCFEYGVKHPINDSSLIIRLGPLPVEEGIYQLELIKKDDITEVKTARRIS